MQNNFQKVKINLALFKISILFGITNVLKYIFFSNKSNAMFCQVFSFTMTHVYFSTLFFFHLSIFIFLSSHINTNTHTALLLLHIFWRQMLHNVSVIDLNHNKFLPFNEREIEWEQKRERKCYSTEDGWRCRDKPDLVF